MTEKTAAQWAQEVKEANDAARLAMAGQRAAELEERFGSRVVSPKDVMQTASTDKVITITVDTSVVMPTPSASGKSMTYCAGYTRGINVDGMSGYVRCTVGVYQRDFNLIDPDAVDTSVLK